MSLKSGRKVKYTGGSFADRFKTSLAMKSPLNEVVVAGQGDESLSPEAETKAEIDKQSNPTDEIKSDFSAKKDEVDAYTMRRKLAEEKAAFESEKEEAENPSDDTNPEGFTNDYGDAGSKKEIKSEFKENKAEIKDSFKDAKADIKDQGLKGKEKRQAKSGARKDKRGSKKANRKAKKTAKKGLKGK